MAKKRFAKDPLLYIHQPKESNPKAPMQYTSYTNAEKKQHLASEQKPVEKKQKEVLGPISTHARRRSFLEEQALHQEKRQKDEPEFGEIVEKKYEEKVPEHDEETKSPVRETETEKKERPKFKDMTIEEKVAYFVATPSYAPQMRCEIRTGERSYRGVITGSEDNYVYIKVGNRKQSTKINLDDIKHIKLLGF
ncbi:hypothetical protein BN988_01116 [Oceanobacillus picturae]|uniref:Spore coat protein CotO n=1 Tax=Oceanobacillus picturae TaxID=171693 RepID=W9AIB1_9BACI|nr:CotO family spore coat protein [Oceanobacillus picturae]CDO02642.1 hypothetical protein BN988_01116 [Oceanobacillus picturae]